MHPLCPDPLYCHCHPLQDADAAATALATSAATAAAASMHASGIGSVFFRLEAPKTPKAMLAFEGSLARPSLWVEKEPVLEPMPLQLAQLEGSLLTLPLQGECLPTSAVRWGAVFLMPEGRGGAKKLGKTPESLVLFGPVSHPTLHGSPAALHDTPTCLPGFDGQVHPLLLPARHYHSASLSCS